ncbi:MAG TPA: hypothetical protein EYG08_07185 [Myxococcales bacterium]|nr:hypothetical protein [Myxococcales bacterium]
MPAIAGKVVQAADNPDSSIDDIRSLIEQDAASMKDAYKRFGLMEKLLWQHSSLAGPRRRNARQISGNRH